ncbi:AbrB/MazE/SpoVT family DNA-binding domain-containing protein [Salinarimonas ramus]|uniref:AbrB family transcriptional regulator n=1 Tax=Salinarimonas ramus TaxID=690164 RepID=A0A917Q7T7_9HYPH|nr:AbrB/MazE/SpoVT family DNA-binding domain-containing protein [Salinarimonas ramus]GGK32709.1 AbrB family transcriptional regulator [Salinarimonas ramus]
MSKVTSRVTAKGAGTIPEDVRRLLGLEPGSEVEFARTEDGSVVIRKMDASRRVPLESLRGHAGPGMSTDEIMRLTRGRAPGDPL